MPLFSKFLAMSRNFKITLGDKGNCTSKHLLNKRNDNEYLNRTLLTNQTNNENCISSLQVFVGTYSTIFKKIVFQGLEKKFGRINFFIHYYKYITYISIGI